MKAVLSGQPFLLLFVTMHIYKFKKALEDDSLAVTITAKDLLDASRYMNLLKQLEPENYCDINLDCVRVLDVERIDYREDRVVHYVYPYPKYILER